MDEIGKSLSQTSQYLKYLSSKIQETKLESTKLDWERFINDIGVLTKWFQNVSDTVDPMLKNYVAFPIKRNSPEIEQPYDFLKSAEIPELISEFEQNREAFLEKLKQQGITKQTASEEEIFSLLTDNYLQHQLLCDQSIEVINQFEAKQDLSFPKPQPPPSKTDAERFAILRAIETGEGLPVPENFTK